MYVFIRCLLKDLLTYLVHEDRLNFIKFIELVFVHSIVQVNLLQNHLFLFQLTHNMTTDCSLNYKFNTWKFQGQAWGEHVVDRNCFWHSEQFLYTICSPHVSQKEELLTKIYLYYSSYKCNFKVLLLLKSHWFHTAPSSFRWHYTEELYSIVSLREIKSHNGWDFPWKFYQNARRDHKWRFAQKTKGTQLSSAAAQSRGQVRILILGCLVLRTRLLSPLP